MSTHCTHCHESTAQSVVFCMCGNELCADCDRVGACKVCRVAHAITLCDETTQVRATPTLSQVTAQTNEAYMCATSAYVCAVRNGANADTLRTLWVEANECRPMSELADA